MASTYRVKVFGKPGCDKCKVLRERLDKLLEEDEWSDFDKVYCDLQTEEGLVDFCEAECINPQRIPALLVTRYDEATGDYEALPNRNPGQKCNVCKNSRLFQHLGLQTDYTEVGRGVISPRMITTVLAEARA